MNKIQKLQKLIIAGIFFIASSAVFAAEPPPPSSSVKPTLTKPAALPKGVFITGTQVKNKVGGIAAPIPPVKQIEIINNTDNTIYPYIFIGAHLTPDQWMQALFGVNRASCPDCNFFSNQVYRVYVGVNKQNGTIEGMKKKTVAVINIPFYSTLLDNASPTVTNSYIDWWNGGRVSIVNDKKSLNDEMERLGDKVIPNPQRAQLTCGAAPSDLPPSLKYDCSVSQTYSPSPNPAAFDPRMPEQLNEYTFGDINPDTDPYLFDPTNVGYNISYVDHFYLPIAIETINNTDRKKVVGYVGTVKTVQATTDKMNLFVADQGWPKFKQDNYEFPAGTYKLPGTYNVINDTGIDIEPSAIKQNLVDNWFSCVADKNNPNHEYCAKIDNLFQKNYAVFPAKCAAQFPGDQEPPISQRPEFYVKHIYGWVAFDDCLKGTLVANKAKGFDSNDLKDTIGGDFTGSEAAYQDLQYSTAEMSPVNHLYFNPYVQLIHGATYMGMIGAYAYSIDDKVGFMHFPGDGIIIAIGGVDGLPNPNEYDKSKIINVGLGGTDNLKIHWASYQLPNQLPTQLKGVGAFSIANELLPAGSNFDYPITVKDSAGSSYTFSITNKAPFETKTASDYTKCNDPNSLWCKGLTVNYTGDGKFKISTIGAPSPVDVKDITVSFGVLPDDKNPIYWNKYGLCKYTPDTDFDTTPNKTNKRASSFTIHSDDIKFPCQIVAQDVKGTLYYFTVNKPAPFAPNPVKDTYRTCGVGTIGKSPPQWCTDGLNPSLSAGTPPNQSSINGRVGVSAFNAAKISSANFVGDNIVMNFVPAVPGSNPNPGNLSYVYFVNGLPCDTSASTCISSASIKNKLNDQSVTLSHVPTNADAIITILATYSGLASEMSTPVTVHPAGGITINTITAAREQDPANVDLTFTQPPVSGGVPGYTFTYTVNGNPFTPEGDPTTKLIFKGVGLDELKIGIHVEDSAEPTHNKADTEVTVKAATPIGKLVVPAIMTKPVRQGNGQVMFDFVPAFYKDGTPSDFTYTDTIDGKPASPPQISGNQILLSGFTDAAADVVLTATGAFGSANTPAHVPAAGGGFNPPSIPNGGAVWFPGSQTTILLGYKEASGGSGYFDYSYNVDGQNWSNFTPQNKNIVYLNGLSNIQHVIKVCAKDKNNPQLPTQCSNSVTVQPQ